MKIRSARDTDAPAIARIWQSSIRNLCSGHYTQEKIESWVCDKTPENVLERIRLEEIFVVAETAGLIAGFCCATFELGTLALYVAPDCIHRGVGSRLLSFIERMAVRSGYTVLTLHSALNAVGFYEKQGYTRVMPNPASAGRESIEMRKQLLPAFRQQR